MTKAEKQKAFLGDWYIINAAKNWLGVDLSFNMCDDVRALYRGSSKKVGLTNEQHFENVLIEYHQKLQDEQAENED